MDIRSRSNPSECSPTKRGGKRSKEEEEGPLLHAPLPPKGVLRCLRSSGLTFSFSQFRVRTCSLTSIYFLKKISKKYFGFFSGNFISSEILSLRLPFCWPLVLRAIFSSLSPGIYRLFRRVLVCRLVFCGSFLAHITMFFLLLYLVSAEI